VIKRSDGNIVEFVARLVGRHRSNYQLFSCEKEDVLAGQNLQIWITCRKSEVF